MASVFTSVEASSASDGEFKPLQYLGSKWRFANSIVEVATSLVGDAPVADVFAGSGVVARRFATSRPVFASDVQEYSRVVTSALLAVPDDPDRTLQRFSAALSEHRRHMLSKPAIADLIDTEFRAYSAPEPDRTGALELALWDPDSAKADGIKGLIAAAQRAAGLDTQSVIFRNYGGLYFSFTQALALDAMATAARSLSGTERDSALAAVISAASDLAGSVGGHFAQPIRPRNRHGQIKLGSVNAITRSRRKDPWALMEKWLTRYLTLPAPSFPSRVERLDFVDALRDMPEETALVYADPPYTRDHYSRFYHVLETLALGDDPGRSSTTVRGSRTPSRGAYRLDRHQSPFSIRSRAGEAFDLLFRRCASRKIPALLSYSPGGPGTVARPETRVMTIEALVDRAGRHYRDVYEFPIGLGAHSKFNRRELNAEVDYSAEVLIVCSNPR